MRKMYQRQAVEFVKLLEQAHSEIQNAIDKKDISAARSLLSDCQEGAIQLGTLIETEEGENCATIPFLEAYCEVVYQIHEELGTAASVNGHNSYKKLRKALIQVSNSIRNDIKARPEIVFMPYKASMWDSLESIWMAADADPDCDAYVVPIPYYERNADGSLGKIHYEGGSMPEYVPVVHYDNYSLEDRHPDVIYIHNPYDEGNYVTSVDPRYYSHELKKYTEKLVYVPYYATSGNMSEGQAHCLAYANVDYIVIQSEKLKKFFDPSIPQNKFLPLGSPKFDKVIRLCQNPPEPPAAWKERMVRADGTKKKVYFYNTSINGMLGDTRRFLQKMEYVFSTFQGREDACLLWRPHPLLESTFDSMRPQFRGFYEQLKRRFHQERLGIYDDTPDMEKTIALCDAYIGDSATSVTSLFGLAGKPLFIMNNNINTLPEEDDWRGEIITSFNIFTINGPDDWKITQGNKLYYAPKHDYHYEFYCDLSDKASGNYYAAVVEVGEKVYVCPGNAQDVLLIADHKIQKRIQLERRVERMGAFTGPWKCGDDIYLIPRLYPAIVKIDTKTDRVSYLTGYNDVFVKNVQRDRRVGGSCVWNGCLYLASPTDAQVLAIDGATGKVQHLQVGKDSNVGCIFMIPVEDHIWLLPYEGKALIRWNPETGQEKVYSAVPDGFRCMQFPHGYPCTERPFYTIAESDTKIILSPGWGNMFVSIDKETGKAEEWLPPFEMNAEGKNGYYTAGTRGLFLRRADSLGEGTWRFYDVPKRRLYDVNIKTKEYKEIDIFFDVEELKKHEPGFAVCSDWLQYACEEKALNSLKDFLDGNLNGNAFDREQQIKAFGEIAANGDGTCGNKIHGFVMERR